MIISMDFQEEIKRNVENRVLVCFQVLDVYFPAVFMVGKKGMTLGMNTLDHVITVPSFFKVNLSFKFIFLNLNTVKPLLNRHLRDLPKCPLNRGCLLNDLLTINTQRLLCTVIKFHVVEETLRKLRKLCCTLRKAFR